MLYRHYKGGLYMLIGWGKMEGDKSEMAVYQSVEDNPEFPGLIIRPAEEFRRNYTLITGDETARVAELVDAPGSNPGSTLTG